MIKLNDKITLKIIDLDYKGDGVSIYNNFYVYIKGALEGEIVEVKIIKIKNKFLIGKLIKIIERSKNRVGALNILGALNLMHLSFAKQLSWQEKETFKALNKVFKKEIKIEKIITDYNEFNYRNKVVFHVLKDNIIKLGLYENENKKLIIVDDFTLAFKIVNNLIKNINESNIKIDSNLLKGICFKNNLEDEILVTLIAKKKNFVGKNELIDFFIKRKNIKTITLNIKDDDNKIMGEKSYILYGDSHLKIENLIMNDQSFLQVNVPVMKMTYEIIKNNIKGKKIIDAYSGIGSIGFSLVKDDLKIIMIEKTDENIKLAKLIKEKNNLNNVEIIKGDVKDIFPQIAGDVIILDPPRAGIENDLIEKIKEKNIKQVFYLSCNLTTLIRDLKDFSEIYEIKKVFPIKMFPQTTAIETLVILKLKETTVAK